VSGWSDDQIQAAIEGGLGIPTDLQGSMPLVDPAASTHDVEAMAHDIVKSILAMRPSAAFVAGEPTLTLVLVRELQARGIRCVSATTERRSIERKIGDKIEKVSQFCFVRWRDYPKLG